MQYSICVARSTDTGHPHIGIDDYVHWTNDCTYAIKQQPVDSVARACRSCGIGRRSCAIGKYPYLQFHRHIRG
jgi:hypothetical protein